MPAKKFTFICGPDDFLVGRMGRQRFEAPGLNGFNFLLEDALGGGGMASRRIDPQGKAFGQMALEMTVPVPKSLAAKIN